MGFVITEMEYRHTSYLIERAKRKAKRDKISYDNLQCLISSRLKKEHNAADKGGR